MRNADKRRPPARQVTLQMPQLQPSTVFALLYRRVSSEEQAREGLSLHAQRASLRRYAVDKGWVIGSEWEDVLSGSRTDRPGYQALLTEARRLRATGLNVVVVVKWLDRFGRSVRERARCAEDLRALGIALHSVMEGGEIPELVSNILAAVAEEEVRRLTERVREVRQYVIDGGWYYPARVPWGYRLRPSTTGERAEGAPRSVLDIDPACAPSVREIWHRAAQGASLREITRWAQTLPEGVRGGRKMRYEAIRKMLSAPVYVARHAMGPPDVLTRPVGRWPSIVDEGTWRQVEERLQHELAPRKSQQSPALLAGLLRCPACGAHMILEQPRNQAPYYGCHGRPRCDHHQTATAASIEQLVLTRAQVLVFGLAEAADKDEDGFRRTWLWATHSRSTSTPRGGRGNDPTPAGDSRANEARERWTRAALLLIDGKMSQRAYARVRVQCRGELSSGASPPVGPYLVSAPSQLADTRTTPPRARALLMELAAWSAALRVGDTIARRRVLAALYERVLPVRIRLSRYRVDLRWTPTGEALRTTARELRVEGFGPDATFDRTDVFEVQRFQPTRAAGRMYSSDLTDAQWELVSELLPRVIGRRLGPQRQLALRSIFNGLLYVARTRCPRRCLPSHFPSSSAVHWYLARWAEDGTFARLNSALLERVPIESVRASPYSDDIGFRGGKVPTGRAALPLIDSLSGLLQAFEQAALVLPFKG